MRVAYKRVSTVVQNTARQLQGIEVDKVFEDKVSGKNIDQRIQLKELLEFVGSVRISVSGEVIPGAAQRGCPLFFVMQYARPDAIARVV